MGLPEFYLSCDVNLENKKVKVRRKLEKYRDSTEFHIGNSTFLVPPWVALVYTTHPRRRKLPRPPIVNGAKYMETMFIMNVSNIEAETKEPVQVTAQPILESKSGVLLM